MPKDISISFDPDCYISTIAVALKDENECYKINLDSVWVGNEIWKTIEHARHIRLFSDTTNLFYIFLMYWSVCNVMPLHLLFKKTSWA